MIGELLGRFHPLVVHLPIGILMVAYVMEIASKLERFKNIKPAIPFVLGIGILTGILALLTGWVMPKEGDFNERLIGLHLWSAVAMTISSVVVYLLSETKRASLKMWYFPVFTLCMILIAVTGHFGGSLTHGEGHLTQSLEVEEEISIADIDEAFAFANVVRLILKAKCFSCHNEGKKKGGLIMSTKEGLLAGGDEGKIIIAGNPQKSPLLQRVHLPLEDEAHMPPEGKKQLTKNETKLLTWWIAKGASLEQKVGTIEQDEEISNILKTYEKAEGSINTKNLIRPSDDAFIKLARQGYSVQALDETSPLLHVKYNNQKAITSGKLKALKKHSKNIVALDISNSAISDGMMSQVKGLSNLQELRLQNTRVTSEGLTGLEKLKHLWYLNIYKTRVDDHALPTLGKLPSLRALYLWQTDISDKGMTDFQETHPLVKVQRSIDYSIFSEARLKPPVIDTEDKIFVDTATVSLNLNFKNVDIYYTIDGTDPDSTSFLYNGPITIKETSEIRAISMKKDWLPSEVTDIVITKAGYAITDISLSSPPNKKYKGSGPRTLIDLEKANTDLFNGKWLGYYGKHLTVKLDLGELKKVSKTTLSALEAPEQFVFFPKAVEVST